MNVKRTRILSSKKIKDKVQLLKEIEEEKLVKYKSNIKTIAIIRPLTLNETEISKIEAVKIIDKSTLYTLDYNEISNPKQGNGSGKYFTFNYAYDKNTNIDDIYTQSIKENIQNAISNKKNISLLSYGINSSGKTYNLYGNSTSKPGIVSRLVEEILIYKDKLNNKQFNMNILFSLFEIIHDDYRDLIDESNNKANTNKIFIKDDPNKGTLLSGISVFNIISHKEFLDVIQKANLNRSKDVSNNNKDMSISTVILQIIIEYISIKKENGNRECSYSKILICDLADSDRSMPQVGFSIKSNESAMVNNKPISSRNVLSNFYKCIDGLVEFGQTGKGFIPWRDSSLTRLLKDCMENASNIFLLINLSPNVIHLEETLFSLKFGQKVSDIKPSNKRSLNNMPYEDSQLTKYENEIKKSRLELENIKQQLAIELHSQLLKGGNKSIYSNNIEKVLKEINAHFNEEVSNKKEIVHIKKQIEIIKNEIVYLDYELFRLQFGNENIVNKTKGISLQLKDIQKEIQRLNEKIIHYNQKLQELVNISIDLIYKRDEIEMKVNSLMNEKLGSLLNISYQYQKINIEKLDYEYNNQVELLKVKKNDWEISKLINQINKRDIAIENLKNEIGNRGYTMISLDKEYEKIRKIDDFHIENSNIYEKLKEKEEIKKLNINLKENKENYEKIPSQLMVKSVQFENNLYKKIGNNVRENNDNKRRIILSKIHNKIKNGNKNELSLDNFDYSNYKNRNIIKEKVKFNTKTDKIINLNQKGGVSELKLRLIDNMYPNSKFNVFSSINNSKSQLLSNSNVSHNMDNSEELNEKLNKSKYSSLSIKSNKENNKDSLIYKFPKTIQRYRASPYIKSN